ncbi:uncharacterized protein LOC123535166 [Mercenaria mercenaria]|uniref:uncharacterized protein LOC123535166 n=1 Tax=Mercenaria mercenaria TaxID=6596 RepID=UPI00234E7A28|nr:uncharacterized protein LOC123535166 [Mercenaria mercenaria]
MDIFLGFLSLALFLVNVHGECMGKADIVIAVPGSYAVPYFDFSPFEEQLVELIRYFAIEPDQFNIGLVLYGAHTVTIATPQPFKTRVQMNTRVSLLAQRNIHFLKMGHKQNLAKAIREIRHILTKPPDGYDMHILRPGAKKIGIIFAFGPTPKKDIQNVITAATKAKREDGILMYALIANGSAEDFPLIGTDYCRLFSMADFKSGLADAIPDLANGICSSLAAYPMISPSNCFPGTYKKARRIAVTCQVENNMVQPDPNNCGYYYRCAYFDTSPIKFACPPDTLYDPISGICNMKTNVACYNDLVCPTDKPMLHSHPLDCSKFINCFNDFIPHVQSCPKGQVFDLVYQSCNMTTHGSCITPLNHIKPTPAAPDKKPAAANNQSPLALISTRNNEPAAANNQSPLALISTRNNEPAAANNQSPLNLFPARNKKPAAANNRSPLNLFPARNNKPAAANSRSPFANNNNRPAASNNQSPFTNDQFTQFV